MSVMGIHVVTPVAGTAISLAGVPDPVFSQAMVGPGAAVDPDRKPQTVVAPIAGTLLKLKPYAFVVVAEGGKGVLVHLGIDTVNLNGRGFRLLVRQGDVVAAGQPIVRWNPAGIEAGGLSPVVPVIALDAQAEQIDAIAKGAVASGDYLFRWT